MQCYVFQPHEGLHLDPKAEIQDLVKVAVKEYFDSLNLPQMLETHREATTEAPAQYIPGQFYARCLNFLDLLFSEVLELGMRNSTPLVYSIRKGADLEKQNCLFGVHPAVMGKLTSH